MNKGFQLERLKHKTLCEKFLKIPQRLSKKWVNKPLCKISKVGITNYKIKLDIIFNMRAIISMIYKQHLLVLVIANRLESISVSCDYLQQI